MSKEGDEIIMLDPLTCGIYKDGGTRYKIDPVTGLRTSDVDNQLAEHVEKYILGDSPPGLARVPISEVFRKGVLVPTYYDPRWTEDFRAFLDSQALKAISLGELEDQGIIAIRGGHGSPGNDMRNGNIPYIKVSDIRALRINVNPTNLVPAPVAVRLWRGDHSGLEAWDLITPNRASSNIGEFAILLPGEERIVLTKEVFVVRILNQENGWDPFYLFWALCLKSVRKLWRRVALMQTNREDVGLRYREIQVPLPPSVEWAHRVSAPFRSYFMTLAESRQRFIEALATSGYDYVVAAYTTGSTEVPERTEESGNEDGGQSEAQPPLEEESVG
jgi:type I restriction enzyme M protein